MDTCYEYEGFKAISSYLPLFPGLSFPCRILTSVFFFRCATFPPATKARPAPVRLLLSLGKNYEGATWCCHCGNKKIDPCTRVTKTDFPFGFWSFFSLEGGSSIVGYDPMASVNVRIDQTRGASYCHQNVPKLTKHNLRQWPSCVLGSVGVCLCPVRPTNFFWLSGCLLVGWVFCASRTSAEPGNWKQTRLKVQQVSEQVAKEEMFEAVWFDLIHIMLWDVHGEPIVICEKVRGCKISTRKGL